MGKIIAGTTISLDGFINDKEGSVDKLYTDFMELKEQVSFQNMIQNTGAVVMGKGTYEMADPFSWINEEYEFQVPIFVLTHTPPAKYPEGNDKLTLTFITDGIESAIARAKEAAGDKDVQVIGGAHTLQQCLNQGLCDEFHLDIISVVLGNGLKLFENIDTDKFTFELIKAEKVTSIRTNLQNKLTKTSN